MISFGYEISKICKFVETEIDDCLQYSLCLGGTSAVGTSKELESEGLRLSIKEAEMRESDCCAWYGLKTLVPLD